MKYIYDTENVHLNAPSAVTLGKFDGVHRGHQKLMERILKAKDEGLCSVVFTFDLPPSASLSGQPASMLLTNRERRCFLEKMGIDVLIEYPFTEPVSHMEPEVFVRRILSESLDAKKIVIGEDFHFGYRRRGDGALLKKMQEECGYDLEVLEKERIDCRIVSSTYIKEELQKGNMETVNRLLGYPYTVQGEIIHGFHMGRSFGWPTINQRPSQTKKLPPNGVYVSRTNIDGILYRGVTNVGNKPTIEGGLPKGVETFLFDVNQDFYGKTADVSLLSFLRPETKFGSKDELMAQVERDKAAAEAYFHK